MKSVIKSNANIVAFMILHIVCHLNLPFKQREFYINFHAFYHIKNEYFVVKKAAREFLIDSYSFWQY